MATAQQQLDVFLDKYEPAVASLARKALNKLTKRLPAANRLTYDNYNALAIGFSTNESQSGIILSIALYPRWVSLFLVGGPKLPDPGKRLKGSGSTVRHVVLDDAATLDDPEIAALIDAAVKLARPPLPKVGKGKLIIKSISARQRSRRP